VTPIGVSNRTMRDRIDIVEAAVATVLGGLRTAPSLKRVVFCCFGKESYGHHETSLAVALNAGN